MTPLQQNSPTVTLAADSKTRTQLYDWIRLIATILVIIGHALYTDGYTENGGISYNTPENLSSFYYGPFHDLLRFLWFWVYGYHMPLFFVLSGAVFGLKPVKNVFVFVKKKTRRLLIPYIWAGWFFMLPVKYISDFYNKETLLLAFKGLPLGIDSGHLWFLLALFWSTIIFLLLQKCLQHLGIHNAYWLLGISCVISLICPYLPFDIFYLQRGLENLIWFAFGYVFETERKRFEKWNMQKVLFFCGAAFLLSYFQKEYEILPDFGISLLGCIRIILIADICMRLFPTFWGTKTGIVLSRNLFNVYLFHDPLEYLILKIFFTSTLLTTQVGCILYYLTRLLLVGIVSIGIGEGIRLVCNWGKRYVKFYNKDGAML